MLNFLVSVCSRKESYTLDYCYEQSEGNEMVFEREVKPLIQGLLDGINATIVAYGARGSGKTHVLQVGVFSCLWFLCFLLCF